MLTPQVLKTNEIFKLLDNMCISPSQYLIMGSGIMFALGIRPLKELEDLDPFEDILDVLEWKKARGKQKDMRHIEMINKYQKKN